MVDQSSSVAPRSALLVCESPPVDGLSGASTYNHAVFNAFRLLGYAVDIIVTTPRLQNLDNAPLLDPGARRIDYLHAELRNGRLAATSTPARLRRIKHGLIRLTGGRTPLVKSGEVAHFGRWLDPQEKQRIAHLVSDRRYDVIAFDTIFRSPALDVFNQGVRLLIAHDIFFERTRSFEANGFPVGTPVQRDQEAALWREYDAILAINPVDRKIMAELVDTPVTTFLPTISLEPVQRARSSGREILYLGTTAYHNVDGLRWFLSDVWPQVRAARPDVTLLVAGNIKTAFENEAHEGVEFLGRIDNLDALAAQCVFSINPLRMGSGIKIKMVDYFKLGLPCIVSQNGAHGFPEQPSPPFATVASTDEFAAMTIDWLTGDAPTRFAARIHDYMQQFTPEVGAASLAALIDNAASTDRTASAQSQGAI